MLHNESSEFEIEDGMVMKYFGMGGVVVVPDGVTDIFFQVFSENTTIKKLIIPGSISAVTAFEFEGCTALTEVTLRDGVEAIDWGAFRGCAALTKIVIPKTLRRIHTMAFAGCSSLKEICFGGSKAAWSRLKKGDDWDKSTGDYSIFFDYTEN